MEKEEEIKKLKERLKLIEEYYEESSFIKRIRFYLMNYIKEKKRYANYRNNSEDDTTRDNTICNNRNGNTWDNEISKIFNGKKVEKENN